MTDPVYIYIYYIYEFIGTLFLNEPELICFHTVKWCQVLLSNTNSFICTQFNDFKYYYLTLIILFNIYNAL